MKTRSIPDTTKWWLTVIMFLALLPWDGIAEVADQSLTAALGPDDLGSITFQLAPPESPPKQTIPPYEEKERIAIPESFGAGQECYATAYEAVVDDLHDFPALLCFSCTKGKKARTCFEARSEPWFHQNVFDRLEIVPILRDSEPREGILFTPAYSGGSAWSKLLTLWVYSRECGQFVNVLPEILITMRDAFKFLNDAKGKHPGVLVTAMQEPDLESRPNIDYCAYRIRIYQYSHKVKKFVLVSGGEFLTEKKYVYVSDIESDTGVIDDNMRKIKRILDRK